MQEEHNNALPKGTMLYEFEIDSVLGQGGFGITYKAKDTHLDTYMVIKEYMPSQYASRSNHATVTCISKDRDTFEWGKQRFLEEAKILKKFDHISIVKALRYFEANGTAYFVMDFYEGQTLEDYFQSHPNKRYSQDEILSVMMPIIEGLKAVHEQGFLHRDIAPDNIFLRVNKPPILIDFGASRNALGTKSQNISAIVKNGYSPPEQYTSSSKQDQTTDLYSISAVMYEMVTGKKPPESTHRQNEKFLNDNEDPLEDIVMSYQNRFEPSFLQTIQKGLSLKQNDRIQTIREYQEGLVREEEVESSPPLEIVYIKCKDGHFYDNRLSVCPECEVDKNSSEYQLASIETKKNQSQSSVIEITKEETTVQKDEDKGEKKKSNAIKWILFSVIVLIVLGGVAVVMDQQAKNKSIADAKKIKIEYITPSDNLCKSKGGEMDDKGVCKANWENAQKICSASGGRLPTIEELRGVVSGCGGVIDKGSKNKASTTYQSCHKELGYSDLDYYWSSSPYVSDSSEAWYVFFKSGFDGWDDKSYAYLVRCVQESK